jgi:hypothetical protein
MTVIFTIIGAGRDAMMISFAIPPLSIIHTRVREAVISDTLRVPAPTKFKQKPEDLSQYFR